MGLLYILDKDGSPEPCEDALKWATWMHNEREKRIIKRTDMDGGIFVSTVFLGCDHSFLDPRPILYETMIFNDKNSLFDDITERYYTREEALNGHDKIVELVKNNENKGL